MRRIAHWTLAALMGLSGPLALADEAKPTEEKTAPAAAAAAERARIEIAILLDTSNSMDGLINQARTRLWAIVNELARTEKDGQRPDLRVALYEYGNNSLSKESGYIREVCPLTDDLDRISEALFGLVTNGGDEYCGAVIDRAVKNLKWSEGDHFRAIFIAGNEPFTQGHVAYREACKAALEKSVIVNTIHCGNESAGRSGEWDQAARIADGRFINIDADQAEVAIVAPQDERLRTLNRELNETYIWYGDAGRARKERQMSQDAEAAKAPAGEEALVQRAIAKGSGAYRNSGWDLVDGLVEKKVKLEDLKDEDLPESMRGKTLEEKQALVDTMAKRRAEIQAEIQTLSEARRRHVAVERQKLAEGSQDTFSRAVGKMLDEQLEKKGFEKK